MFTKGYKQTKEQQAKMKQSRAKRYGYTECVICKKPFPKYHKNQKICSSEKCRQKDAVNKYNELALTNPIAYRARTLSGTLRLGKNKQKIVVKMLEDAIGNKCPYCGNIITLESASIDHKTPRINSKVYNRKTKKMTYTKEELLEIDHPDNLHIVCRECNLLKSDFSHDEFLKVLRFIEENPILGRKLKARLNRAIVVFRKFRKAS